MPRATFLRPPRIPRPSLSPTSSTLISTPLWPGRSAWRSPTPRLTVDEAVSRPAGDFYAYTEKSAEHQTLVLKPGSFLVAFPDDAHRCKGQVDGPSHVEKIVFKILIE